MCGIIHPKRVREFFEINVDGTRILEAAQNNKIKKAIIVSSNSPCGTNPHNDHLFNEGYKYNPYMKYGYSKMLMEKLVKNILKKVSSKQ